MREPASPAASHTSSGGSDQPGGNERRRPPDQSRADHARDALPKFPDTTARVKVAEKAREHLKNWSLDHEGITMAKSKPLFTDHRKDGKTLVPPVVDWGWQ